MKELLNNPLINKSEVARQIGLLPAMFSQKLNNRNYNKFNPAEIKKIKELFLALNKEIDEFINN